MRQNGYTEREMADSYAFLFVESDRQVGSVLFFLGGGWGLKQICLHLSPFFVCMHYSLFLMYVIIHSHTKYV